MSKVQTIFARHESKYMVTYEQREKLLALAGERVTKDKFFKGTVCSVYYDTPSKLLIRTSIDKPPYKEKIRMRSYGVPTSSDNVFLEIKKKYKGVVYKRRSVFSLSDAQAFMNGKIAPKSQIERELEYTISFYDDIMPSVYISYDRTSFCGVEDNHFRLTFDNNLIYRENELSLDKGIWGEKLLDSGVYIMEVKFPNSMPLWFSNILDEMKIFPASYSKYGTIYSSSESFKQLRDLDFSTNDDVDVESVLSRAISAV